MRVNDRFLYGKFVKVALNVLKEQPTDDPASPNLLASELRHLLVMGEAPTRAHRVRFVSLPREGAWVLERA